MSAHHPHLPPPLEEIDQIQLSQVDENRGSVSSKSNSQPAMNLKRTALSNVANVDQTRMLSKVSKTSEKSTPAQEQTNKNKDLPKIVAPENDSTPQTPFVSSPFSRMTVASTGPSAESKKSSKMNPPSSPSNLWLRGSSKQQIKIVTKVASRRKFLFEDLKFSSVQQIFNIDAGREENPAHCTVYAPEIFDYLKENESRRPTSDFLSSVQVEITEEMLGILFDWLVDVAEEYSLSSDTLFYTQKYVNIYLSKVAVPRTRLQLVGIAALLIAAKFEEIYTPSIEEFVYISDGSYERAQILAMELEMLRTLEFSLSIATEKIFLRRYQRAAAANLSCRTVLNKISMLSSYLLELTLQEYRFHKFPPSIVAASSTALSLLLYGLPPWSATLEHYTGYQWSNLQLQECLEKHYQVFKQAENHKLKAVFEKYSSPKYLEVAKMIVPNF